MILSYASRWWKLTQKTGGEYGLCSEAFQIGVERGG